MISKCLQNYMPRESQLHLLRAVIFAIGGSVSRACSISPCARSARLHPDRIARRGRGGWRRLGQHVAQRLRRGWGLPESRPAGRRLPGAGRCALQRQLLGSAQPWHPTVGGGAEGADLAAADLAPDAGPRSRSGPTDPSGPGPVGGGSTVKPRACASRTRLAHCAAAGCVLSGDWKRNGTRADAATRHDGACCWYAELVIGCGSLAPHAVARRVGPGAPPCLRQPWAKRAGPSPTPRFVARGVCMAHSAQRKQPEQSWHIQADPDIRLQVPRALQQYRSSCAGVSC
jgi:hypothetical protein